MMKSAHFLPEIFAAVLATKASFAESVTILTAAKLEQTRKIATDKVELKAHINEVSTPMRCIAPMDVVSKAELRSENTH